MNGQSSGHVSADGGFAARPLAWLRWRLRPEPVLWLGLTLLLPGLAGCHKPAPMPHSEEQTENKYLPPPPPPKTYAERTSDRLVLIKDRLQLLKDQAAPLRGPSLHTATMHIRSIEIEIHDADKEVGRIRGQEVPPAQQAIINRRLTQIEQAIDAASQEIASNQGRR